MSLPVSCTHYHTPPMNYPPNNPPAVPNVQVLPEAQSLLVPVSAAVATIAGMTANTDSRIFCYNLLADNNFHNPTFASVVKAACDFLVYKNRNNQAPNMAVAIDATVTELLTAFTSLQIMTYPELYQTTPPDLLHTASNNANVYNRLLQQFEQMYSRPISAPYGGRQHPGQAQGQHPFFPRRGGPQPIAHPAGSNMASNPAAQTQPRRSPQRGYNAPTNPKPDTAQAPAAAPAVSDTVIQGEIENMDREAHCIVYFGETYSVPTAPIRRAMEVAVENHETLANAETLVDTPYVAKTWEAQPSLDELIAVTRVRFLSESPDDTGVYINHGFVVKPVIVDQRVGDGLFSLLRQLSTSNTFGEVSRVLKEHGLKMAKDATPTELRLVLSYMAQLDRLLTPIANHFLENLIDYKSLRIGSFIEDADSMAAILNDKFKGKYNKYLNDYQRRVLEHLFKHTKVLNGVDYAVAAAISYDMIRPDDSSTDPDATVVVEPKVSWDCLAEAYTLIYINATAKELGYNVSDKTREVLAVNTPMLSRLLRAIQKSQADAIVTSKYLLVTSDDARYAFYVVNGDQQTFALKEV